MRKIIHIDMDAFFASVEQRNNPSLKGKPVVVGGQPHSRGVVAAASYEARQFGIRSAMPSRKAYQLCSHAVFVRPNFEQYKAASLQIHQIFKEYTEMVEPLSLDEAYLDVSHVDRCDGLASLMAKEIRERIFNETQLTASAGISYNKFIAKIASDVNKPNGQCVVPPEKGEAFVGALPIGRFYGVGKRTEEKMKRLGIYSGEDLRHCELTFLQQHFGKQGQYYFDVARGIDHRPVRQNRVRKSVGSETTFQQDKIDIPSMLAILQERLDKVWALLEQRDMLAKTITIKVKYADFQQVTRAHSFLEPVDDKQYFDEQLAVLLSQTEAHFRPVRLLGVSCSGLSSRPQGLLPKQYRLFDAGEE